MGGRGQQYFLDVRCCLFQAGCHVAPDGHEVFYAYLIVRVWFQFADWHAASSTEMSASAFCQPPHSIRHRWDIKALAKPGAAHFFLIDFGERTIAQSRCRS